MRRRETARVAVADGFEPAVDPAARRDASSDRGSRYRFRCARAAGPTRRRCPVSSDATVAPGLRVAGAAGGRHASSVMGPCGRAIQARPASGGRSVAPAVLLDHLDHLGVELGPDLGRPAAHVRNVEAVLLRVAGDGPYLPRADRPHLAGELGRLRRLRIGLRATNGDGVHRTTRPPPHPDRAPAVGSRTSRRLPFRRLRRDLVLHRAVCRHQDRYRLIDRRAVPHPRASGRWQRSIRFAEAAPVPGARNGGERLRWCARQQRRRARSSADASRRSAADERREFDASSGTSPPCAPLPDWRSARASRTSPRRRPRASSRPLWPVGSAPTRPTGRPMNAAPDRPHRRAAIRGERLSSLRARARGASAPPGDPLSSARDAQDRAPTATVWNR
jgi:hypothetical protein